MTAGWAHHLKSSHRANSKRLLGNGNETLSLCSRRHLLVQSKSFLSSVRLAMQSWECRTLMRFSTFTVCSPALHDCPGYPLTDLQQWALAHWMCHYLPAAATTNSCSAKCCCLTGMRTVCCWPNKDHSHAAFSMLLPCHQICATHFHTKPSKAADHTILRTCLCLWLTFSWCAFMNEIEKSSVVVCWGFCFLLLWSHKGRNQYTSIKKSIYSTQSSKTRLRDGLKGISEAIFTVTVLYKHVTLA